MIGKHDLVLRSRRRTLAGLANVQSLLNEVSGLLIDASVLHPVEKESFDEIYSVLASAIRRVNNLAVRIEQE